MPPNKITIANGPSAFPDYNRSVVQHDYHDHSRVTMRDFILSKSGDINSSPIQRPRGGALASFPTTLHIILSIEEKNGNAGIFSWQPHGRCFVIHKPKEFAQKIMPNYFKQTKFTSFQRQLNIYGFIRLTSGKDHGGYYHEFFLRHKLILCENIIRTEIKGTGVKGKPSPDTEPLFYSMSPLEPEPAFNSGSTAESLESNAAVATEEEEEELVTNVGSSLSKCHASKKVCQATLCPVEKGHFCCGDTKVPARSVGCVSSNSRVVGYNYSRDTHKSQKEPRDSIDIHPCTMFGLKHGLALEENQHNMFGTSSSISMVADADDIASPGIRTKRRRLVSICNKAPPLPSDCDSLASFSITASSFFTNEDSTLSRSSSFCNSITFPTNPLED